ncbi:MAG: ATP synthase F0 subunit B [Desulfobacterales bacterium]|jgi:F-type H+-transporting ATPase subunit b
MNLINQRRSGVGGKNPIIAKGSAMAVILAVFLFCFIFIGPVAASSEAEGGHEGVKGWVATDTYRVMNFTVLVVGLFFLLRKPVSQALDSRIKGIKDQLSELEAKKEGAEKELAKYTERLSHLEQEAEKLIEDYIRQGNEAKARIIDEAKKTVEKLEEQARRNIEHEFKQAKIKLHQDILEKALVNAETLIKNKITSQDQDQLVDEYLEKVVA